jgi:hypothetical protein
MQPHQGSEIFKARLALCGFISQDIGFIVAAESLENCRPLAIRGFDIERKPLGPIDVGQGIVKSMKAGVCSRARARRLRP